MVMEAPPSPQSVGREFVRQYYTLLNKAPMHLHRFYNHQSSFIHGGLDPPNRETSPVIGQKQIHQKIQQLNFRDCHAKITQVDSQATLGNGVVVQVTGELSNAGQPMRRFTQTFVLAAQSPKKYYVHNDIFRYQDEIISDEECEPDAHSEEEEEVILNNQQVIPPEVQLSLSQPPAIPPYYNPTAPTQIAPTIPPVPLHHNQPPPPHVLNAQPSVATVNGAIHPDDISVIPGPVPTHVPPAPSQPGLGSPMPNHQQAVVQPPLNPSPTPIEEPQPTQYQDEPVEEQLDWGAEPQDIVEAEQIVSTEPVSASNEPKTYANLLKSSSNVIPYGNSPSSQPVLGGPLPSTQPRPSSPPGGPNNQVFGSRLGNTASNINNRNPGMGGPGGLRTNQQQPGRLSNRQDSIRSSVSGGGGRNSINEDGGNWEDKRRSQGQGFSDVNQLFLGNLPHTATEDELREIFSEFGIIVDLRVHSKTVTKMGGPPGARAPPNYGFITYETQEGVQTCLQSKPIFYPKGDKNGTTLNVEEKKIKERTFGGSRPLPENNRGGRGDNGGPRRGGPGGLGNGGPNRISSGGPGGANGPNNRNNSYNNRSSGPPNRGPNPYNRR